MSDVLEYYDAMQMQGDRARPHLCAEAYLLTPPEGADVGSLTAVIGQPVKVHIVDTWMQCAHISQFQESRVAVVPLQWLTKTTTHSFPDTGSKRSWCNACGAVGHFDWRSGKYSPE